MFFPDTTDVYDKKNMPKTIFCLHALAVHLHRRRMAPPIRDVSGNVAFTSGGAYLLLTDECNGVFPPFQKRR